MIGYLVRLSPVRKGNGTIATAGIIWSWSVFDAAHMARKWPTNRPEHQVKLRLLLAEVRWVSMCALCIPVSASVFIYDTGSGIGRALCIDLAERGLHVATCDINLDNANYTTDICQQINPEVSAA